MLRVRNTDWVCPQPNLSVDFCRHLRPSSTLRCATRPAERVGVGDLAGLILNIVQIHVAEFLGQKRFCERTDHDERADVNGRNEDRSLRFIGQKNDGRADRRIERLSRQKPKQAGIDHGPWRTCRARRDDQIVSLFWFPFKQVSANLLAFFNQFESGIMRRFDERTTANMTVALE